MMDENIFGHQLVEEHSGPSKLPIEYSEQDQSRGLQKGARICIDSGTVKTLLKTIN